MNKETQVFQRLLKRLIIDDKNLHYKNRPARKLQAMHQSIGQKNFDSEGKAHTNDWLQGHI